MDPPDNPFHVPPPPPVPPGPPARFHRRRQRRTSPSETRTVQDDLSSTEPEEDTGPPVEPGMLLESKDLYRSNPREEWSVWAPEDIGMDAKETDASAKFALIVKRDRIQGDDGSSELQLNSVKVQSPLVKESLGPVFANYPGINTNLKNLNFYAPFREFFYRRKEFFQVSKQLENDETKGAHFKLLFDIIHAEIEPHIKEVEDLMLNNSINFNYLWAIFEPGMEIYSMVDGQHRLYRLSSSNYVSLSDGTKLFCLSCQFIDTDGVHFGYNSATLTIAHFADIMPLAELTVLPAYMKPDMESIYAKLLDRGKKFEVLNGCHYKAYSGVYISASDSWGSSRKATVNTFN